jgi:signal transduction histidine kinase
MRPFVPNALRRSGPQAYSKEELPILKKTAFSYVRTPKKLLKKSLVALVLFFLGSLAAYLLPFLVPSSGASDAWVHHPLLPIFIMTVIFVMAHKPIERWINKLLEKYFFHKKTFAQMTLIDLAGDLAINLDLQEIANLVVNTFGEVLHLKTVALLVPDPLQNNFEIASAYGWTISASKKIRLALDTPLLKMVHQAGPHILMRGPVLQSLAWQEANALARDLDSLQAGWVIPLFVKGELVGLLAFGALVPDTVFDQGDFHFFREFATAIGPCLHNALVVKRLKQLNFELQDSQSQWVQKTKLNAIEKLAAGIAHEIHNPLAIISGKAQVLLMQKGSRQLAPDVQDALNTIVKQTRRAADITRKLLLYSQGSREPREWISLEKVLDETLALIAYQASLDEIEITRNLDTDLPRYHANIQEVREIFLNLLLNAVEAVGSVGKIAIEIKYRREEELLEITCSDTGKGIPAEHLDKVFNPFYTTRHEAVGLGLFVTQQITHRYGGSIRVESQVGIGSMFILQLPCLTETARSGETEKNGAPALSSRAGK